MTVEVSAHDENSISIQTDDGSEVLDATNGVVIRQYLNSPQLLKLDFNIEPDVRFETRGRLAHSVKMINGPVNVTTDSSGTLRLNNKIEFNRLVALSTGNFDDTIQTRGLRFLDTAGGDDHVLVDDLFSINKVRLGAGDDRFESTFGRGAVSIDGGEGE